MENINNEEVKGQTELETQQKKKSKKVSAVTGEKIKQKSVKKIKKEHKEKTKSQKKVDKKLQNKKNKLEKKLDKKAPKFEARTLSNAQGIEAEEDKEKVDSAIENLEPIQENNSSNNIDNKILIVRKTEEAPKTIWQKFTNLLSYALVGIVAVLFGYFAGNFYYANVLSKVDYSQFTEQNLRDNAEQVYNNIKGKVGSASAVEIFVASEYLLGQQEKYTAMCVGSVKPGSFNEQTVRGVKSKNGNIIESSNISRGLMKVAEKYVYDMETQIADVYHVEGSAITAVDKANFGTTPTSVLNYDEFRKEMGTAPENPLVPYIVSSKTYIEGSDSVKDIGLGRYQIQFSLKPDSSVINYIQQVKHMSGFSDFPTFKSITVTAVVDSNLRFLSIRYDELYSVLYQVVLVDCLGYLEQTITY